MRQFKNKIGNIAGETCTVAELREILSQYPDDIPVFAQWEGCNGYVTNDSVSITMVHKGDKLDSCECLVIDVNNY